MAVIEQRATLDAPDRMRFYQIAVIVLLSFVNAADGFDVVSLAVVAPMLSKEWQVNPAVLGSVFSAVAVGLVVGAFLVAPFADRVGRRPIMLGALGTLAATLLLTGSSTAIWQLFVLRFVTGIGLGTLVVCLNTAAAENASVK